MEYSIIQTVEDVKQLWNKYVREDTDGEDALTVDAVQNGHSFFIYGKKAFELKYLKKGTSVRINGELKQIFEPDHENYDEDRFYPVSLIDMSVFPERLKTYKHLLFRNLITITFACCSKFVECSDAKACLHQFDRAYNGCYYRRNLEKGLIFYGKNRNADENGLFKQERPD